METIDLLHKMALKVEESLQKVEHMQNLNKQLLKRLHEKTLEFQQDFHIMTELIVQNQIEFERELYERRHARHVVFRSEAPF